jgi:type II secretory pathway pseudopilin PulG
VEILVALSLVGVLGVVVGALSLPLQLTRRGTASSQALAEGRAYLEMVKATWRDAARWSAMTLPTTTGANADLKLPAGWTLSVTRPQPWTANDTLRVVNVTVGAAPRPGEPDRRVTLSTMVTRP